MNALKKYSRIIQKIIQKLRMDGFIFITRSEFEVWMSE